MKTVILKARSQRGKQKLQQHGRTWKLVKAEADQVLLESLGKTFHVGRGVMETDWRFVKIHGDKDFIIDFGKGQVETTQVRSTVLESTCITGHPHLIANERGKQ